MTHTKGTGSWMLVLLACCCIACSSGDGGSGDGGTEGDAVEVRTVDAAEVTGGMETLEETVAETAGEVGTEEVVEPLPPWYELPFVVAREDSGEPLTDEEVTAFTRAVTGFYRDAGFFQWVWWTSHGLDATYDPEMLDYRLYWQDTQAFREGDAVRFVHTGGADNLMIRTSKIMNNAIAAYLMTGEMEFGRIVRDYGRGTAALSMALEWASEDPLVKYLQARALFTHDHEYVLEGNRKVIVEYGPAKNEKNDENPHCGPIWVRTMRSKDDVPHMFRMVPLLRRVAAEGADPEVREAATLALEYMEGFAKDIVDSGYQIRTKDKEGNALVPIKEDGTVNDLASFVLYDALIPDAECSAKAAAAWIAYGDSQGIDCGEFDHNLYEDLATETHYFNLAIIRFFHLAAATNAIAVEDYAAAETLLYGLVKRSDRYMADKKEPADHSEWYPDLAGWLLAAGASGLPLTSAEARLIMTEYAASATHYAAYPHWDPWAEGMPEGPFEYKAPRDGHVVPGDPESGVRKYIRLPEMSFVLEYCFSPLRAPHGARLLDCEVVADPARWGE